MKSLLILKSAQILNACNLYTFVYTFILFPKLSKSTLFRAGNGLHRKSAHPSYRKTQLYVPTKGAFWVRYLLATAKKDDRNTGLCFAPNSDVGDRASNG